MASCCFCERSRESTSMASSRSFSLKYLRTKTIATGNPNTASTLTMGMSAWIISEDMAPLNVPDPGPFRARGPPREKRGRRSKSRRPLGPSSTTSHEGEPSGTAEVKDLGRGDLLGGSAQMSAFVRPGQQREEPGALLRVASE